MNDPTPSGRRKPHVAPRWFEQGATAGPMTAAPSNPTPSPRRRNTGKFVGVAVAVGALVAGGGLWLLSREETLTWSAAKVAEHTGGRLRYAELHGSLLGTIRVGRIDYEDAFGTVDIRDARMTWRPARLLLGQVAVGSMSAKTVGLRLATSDAKARPPESLRAPISFAITDVEIGSLSVTRDGGTYEIHDLTAALSGSRQQLRAEVKSLATPYGHVSGHLTAGADAPFPLDGRVDLKSLKPGDYAVGMDISGSLMDAVANVDAKAREARVSAKLALSPYEPQPLTALALSANGFDPRAWVTAAPAASISGQVRVVADSSRRLSGVVTLTNGSPGAVDDNKVPVAAVSLTMQGVPADLDLSNVNLDLGDAGRFAGTGTVKQRALDLSLTTTNLNLQGIQRRIKATRLAGRLDAGGDIQTQRVKLDVAQQGYRLRVAGQLRDRVVHVDEAYARAGRAEATAKGQVALDAAKDFSVSGKLARFDPSQFGQYDSALINGHFDLKGQVSPVIQVAANVRVTDSRLFGLPATATGTVRSTRSDHPDVDVDVNVRVGNTRATAKGTMKDPARMDSMDLALTLAGNSLADLYKIVRVPLPPTPAYRIKGRVVQSGQVWELRRFAGAVGGSDLSGNFLLDRGRTPQFMKADLVSRRLDLADLAGFIGAEKTGPGAVSTPQTSRVIPDTPYNLDKLRSADADVRFEGRQILTEKLPIDDMSARIIVKGGVLTLAPLDFGVASGRVVSDIELDATRPVMASRADVRVQSLQLGRLLPQLKMAKASVGQMDGRVRLAATGNSIAALLGSASGDSQLVVDQGEVSDLILRLSNLDLANALVVLMRGDRNIPLRCMVADLEWNNGTVYPRRFIFDTEHTTLVGTGRANFADETLDLRLVAEPKDNSLVSLRGPIDVGGTFGKPSVMPDLTRLGARGVAAAALATIAPPLALVPFVQVGGGQDEQCGPMVRSVRKQMRAPVQASPRTQG